MQSESEQDLSQTKKLNHKYLKDKIELMHSQKQKRIKRLQEQRFKQQQMRQQLELQECTFSPRTAIKATIRQQKFDITQFLKRQQNWSRSKEKKIQQIRDRKHVQQIKKCTFHPQTSSKNLRNTAKMNKRNDLIKIQVNNKKDSELTHKNFDSKVLSNGSSVSILNYGRRTVLAKPSNAKGSKSYKQIHQKKLVMKQHLKQYQKPFHLQTSYGQRWACRNFHHYHLSSQDPIMDRKAQISERSQLNFQHHKILPETNIVPHNSIREIQDCQQQLIHPEIFSQGEADAKLIQIQQQTNQEQHHQKKVQQKKNAQFPSDHLEQKTNYGQSNSKQVQVYGQKCNFQGLNITKNQHYVVKNSIEDNVEQSSQQVLIKTHQEQSLNINPQAYQKLKQQCKDKQIQIGRDVPENVQNTQVKL